MPYIPHNDIDRRAMLNAIGVSSADALFDHIPESLRAGEFDLPDGMPEMELQAHLADLAAANTACDALTCFIGAGAYDHWIPPVVTDIAGKSEFVTAYTPYQPEISQGMLQSIFEYQSEIAALCDLDVSNASMYDGATAALEAAAMACRHTRRDKIVLDRSVHPSYRATISAGMRARGIGVTEIGRFSPDVPPESVPLNELTDAIDDKTACVVTSNPTFFGTVRDLSKLAAACHDAKALLVAVVNPFTLAWIKSPGEMGVDIACGDGQPLGIPLQFGGPYVGFIAAEKKLVRRMPGRIVGETVDADGARAFTLTLQTREQHIRREKATSNICSNQALCALIAGAYMAAVGQAGLVRAAELALTRADYLKRKLADIDGVRVTSGTTFHEFVYTTPQPAAGVLTTMAGRGILGGVALAETFSDLSELSGNEILVAVTEKRSLAEIDAYLAILRDVLASY